MDQKFLIKHRQPRHLLEEEGEIRLRPPPAGPQHVPCVQVHHAGRVPVPLVDGERIHRKALRPVSFPGRLPPPAIGRPVHQLLLDAVCRLPVYPRDPLHRGYRQVEAEEGALFIVGFISA